ncbi:nitroreductase family deazaflavin-dependent oxidoreductase [Nocardia stercoris]|uniref:Nitroreductase family deazaflavin-dependent oxidoreductase n=1 Tax=Nocardia stercoris TaxID=2483361 RepID=A0A3M2L9X7_9NOCA|nr:nitroreductase family deazaflavin-dependent oxidoreductase [Nocardia stercoris]RMI31378.1 nitroreductase family deazaflavin-dependent oxidoreductase [Nocardia stercoris]
MPMPRWLAHANKYGLNQLTRFLAPWLPGWALVVHRGRKSGRTFHTPLWAFRRGDDFVIALTYGSRSDWVRNVEAAGSFELVHLGRHHHLANPNVYRDPKAAEMPLPIRLMLRYVLAAPEFLRATIAPADPKAA